MNYHFQNGWLVISLALLLFSSCEEPASENDQQIKFVKTFGGSEHDSGNSVQQTTDLGYIITGQTNSYGNGKSDIWLIKTDPDGIEEWNQTFGGIMSDGSNSVQQTRDGGFILLGQTNSYGNGSFDIWLIKTDENGNEIWNKTYGGNGEENGNSVQETTDGGYIISGYTNSYGRGSFDVWLIKTDMDGNEVWNKTFGEKSIDKGYSVQQTTDGGYIITGSSNSFGLGSYDLWIIKTDSDGNEEWNKVFEGKGDDGGQSVRQTSDFGYIISGYTKSYGNGSDDIWLIKTGIEGEVEWKKTFGSIGFDKGYSVQQTQDDGYVVTGITTSFGDGSYDIWLIKTDKIGNEDWNRAFGGNGGYDKGYYVQQTSDGGYIVVGTTTTYGNGNSDVWLIKTNTKGNTVTYSNK